MRRVRSLLAVELPEPQTTNQRHKPQTSPAAPRSTNHKPQTGASLKSHRCAACARPVRIGCLWVPTARPGPTGMMVAGGVPGVGAGGPDVGGAAGAGVRRRKFFALSNDISPIFIKLSALMLSTLTQQCTQVCVSAARFDSRPVCIRRVQVCHGPAAPSESRRCFCYSCRSLVVLASAWSISNTASHLKAACVCECWICVAALV